MIKEKIKSFDDLSLSEKRHLLNYRTLADNEKAAHGGRQQERTV